VTNIPPEGDDYNEERKEALYAAITNEAALVKHHAELVRQGAAQRQIDEVGAAMAQTRRDIARISLELHNSTQGKNLNVFLLRMDMSLAPLVKEQEAQRAALDSIATSLQFMVAVIPARLAAIEQSIEHVATESANNWGELSARVDKIDARHAELDDLQKWKEEVTVRMANVEQLDRDALSVRIDRIEAILADLPTRSEQRDDG